MPSFSDQCGRSVFIPDYPQRIISLVPSQTELLYDLGLGERVAGITRFCTRPAAWFRSKTRVGGTKQVNAGLIQQLNPDLIIANKEENVKEQVEYLEKYYPVWVSDVNNLPDALKMIDSIGKITGTEIAAQHISSQIKKNFTQLKIVNHKRKAAYLVWKDPYMAAGGSTFIHSMLEAAGFTNLFGKAARYPQVSVTELQKTGCEILLLSSEPFPFKQQHIDELQSHLPKTKILLVDGEMFSWYGSRLVYAPHYFKELSYPV